MRAVTTGRLGPLLAVLIAVAGSTAPARSESAPQRDVIITQLSQFDTAPELDIAALKQRVLEKSRSRAHQIPDSGSWHREIPGAGFGGAQAAAV